MMKLSVAACVPFFLANIAFAQAPLRNPSVAKPKSEECTISGMVVKFAGNEPLRNTTVELQGLQDLAHTMSVVTDVGGRFELKESIPGVTV